MKFTCLQENLMHALSKVYRAVPVKGELPILSNILITAKDNNVQLAATSLSTTIVTNLGASVETEGAITVPARLFREFITSLPAANINVELISEILHLSSDKTKSKFNGVTAEDFPDLPEKNDKTDFAQIDPKVFSEAVSYVGFSASNDESRPIFTGIFLEFKDNALTIASSDGFRLSEITVPLLSNPINYSVVVPAKTLVDISKVFTESTPIEFGLDEKENMMLFKQEDTMVATRTLSGDYPDYRRIIPENNTTNVEFSVSDLLSAAKMTNIFAKETNSAILLELNPEDNTITLRAAAEEKGEHQSKIEAQIEADKTLNIGFNAKFLIDFLSNIKAERVTLATKGETAHCLFKPLEKENVLHIIMPVGITK